MCEETISNQKDKIVVTCPKCKSPDVTADAVSRWSVETQSWEMSSTFESKTCVSCGYEDDAFDETKLVDLNQNQVDFVTGKVFNYVGEDNDED